MKLEEKQNGTWGSVFGLARTSNERKDLCKEGGYVCLLCVATTPTVLEECTPLYQFLVTKQRPNQMLFENVTDKEGYLKGPERMTKHLRALPALPEEQVWSPATYTACNFSSRASSTFFCLLKTLCSFIYTN